MRRVFLLILINLILLAACGGEEQSSPRATTEGSALPKIRVTVSEALVFQYPARDADILFRLIGGDETPILAQTEPDLIGFVWYQVGQGKQFGWVAGSQVEVLGDVSLVETVSIFEESPTLTPQSQITPTPIQLPDEVTASITVTQATVFDAPDRTAPEVTSLFEGETVDVIGRIEQEDEFYFVGRNGTILGWVLAAQVNVQGDLEYVPVLQDVESSLTEILPEATGQVTPTASPSTPPPSVTATLPPSTPRASVTPSGTPDLASTAQSASTVTPFPVSATPIPEGIDALQPGQPPPLELTLPPQWESVHLLVPLNTVYFQGNLPISIYQGPLEGDLLGTMWIAWGFPNVTSPTGEVNLYGDGVQLLRGLIFDSTSCDIGLGGEQRQYNVGGIEATGTIYSAVNCDGSADIAGFFAVLQVGGGNFAFYVGVEPVTATDTGLPQLQAILDSVQFDLQDDE